MKLIEVNQDNLTFSKNYNILAGQHYTFWVYVDKKYVIWIVKLIEESL